MLEGLMKNLVYLLLLALGAAILFLLNNAVIKPYRKRRYYQQHGKGHVSMTTKFYPFLGDFKIMNEQYVQKGKFVARYFRDLFMVQDAKPLHLLQWPNTDYLLFNDVSWLEDFNKLIPKYVDREPIDNSGFGRIGGTGGIGQIPSGDDWKARRETMMKTIGINYTSKFIPVFLKHLNQHFGKVSEGKDINCSQICNTIVFGIMLEILYGMDVEEKMEKCNYQARDGTTSSVSLYECMMSISEDCMAASMTTLNVLFPVLIRNDIGTENKRNSRNSNEFVRVVKKFIKESDDESSVYKQVVSQLKNPDAVFMDTISFLMGGHETTFMTISSCIYCLKKYPHTMEALKKELDEILLENGKYSPEDFETIFNTDKFDQLEYLTMFVKETLRYHPAAARSLGYKAKRSFKIKDIVIPEGELMGISIIASHFNKDQWIDPEDFIPERFDPNSKYFKTPSGQNRHPLSFIPFTFGSRTCPGRSFSMIEIKVALVYFILKFEYEIDAEVLSNPDITFSVYSPHELHLKVTKVNF